MRAVTTGETLLSSDDFRQRTKPLNKTELQQVPTINDKLCRRMQNTERQLTAREEQQATDEIERALVVMCRLKEVQSMPYCRDDIVINPRLADAFQTCTEEESFAAQFVKGR